MLLPTSDEKILTLRSVVATRFSPFNARDERQMRCPKNHVILIALKGAAQAMTCLGDPCKRVRIILSGGVRCEAQTIVVVCQISRFHAPASMCSSNMCEHSSGPPSLDHGAQADPV